MIDLHTHTSCSDGDYTPLELIELAAGKGLSVISITDHDSIDAYDSDIFVFAKKCGVLLIPGIELSTEDEETGERIHVVGLGIDTNNSELRSICENMHIHRRDALLAAEKKLKQVGVDLRASELLKSNYVITKSHVAIDILSNPANANLLNNKYGEIPHRGKIIEDFLSSNKPATAGKKCRLNTTQAVDIIKRSGGKAICAHPSFNVMRGFDFDDMKRLILRNGFDGIETVNIQYDKSNGDRRFDMVKEFTEFADKSGLLSSGGSDFHGYNKAVWGNSSDLGLANESYRVSKHQLESILS